MGFSSRKDFLTVGQARVAYVRVGGESTKGKTPILFVHGLPASSFLWRHVLEEVAPYWPAIALDLLGLGDTEVRPDADFTMPAQAAMLERFCDALGLERVHLVVHDQGGACGQIFATAHPERIATLTLSNCVCYDNWPVPMVKNLMRLARFPGAESLLRPSSLSRWLLGTRLGMRQLVYNPAAFTSDVIEEYLRAIGSTAERRRRFRNFLLAGDARWTQEVVPALRQFDRPTAVIWAEQDRFLPLEWARRLQQDIPGACRFETIPYAGHYFQEEKPAEFAAKLLAFLG